MALKRTEQSKLLHEAFWSITFAHVGLRAQFFFSKFIKHVFFSFQEGFSVSMKAPDRIKHFRVMYEGGTFNIGPRHFTSFVELIEHYKKSPIFTDKSGEKLFLVKPYEDNSVQ